MYLPDLFRHFRQRFPEIVPAYEELSTKCHQAGPLDERSRRLVKLGIAIGMCSEGSVKSHTRKALQAGVSAEEIRHALLLTLTTAGFPTMMAAVRWADEVIAAQQ